MKLTHHTINKNTFLLSEQRCLFWEEEKTLIVSDLHIGKTGHFRKHGIAVPQTIYKEDLQRLISLISFYKPVRLIVVGDMFHSKENKELDLFLKWRIDLKHIDLHLVLGNHDILEKSWYKTSLIDHSSELTIGNFHFVHDINSIDELDTSMYYFSGHVHPAVNIQGVGKQHISLPCFYFTKQHAILPAFSKFSGMSLIKPQRTDSVYAILEKGCMKL
ncbi:ligase-associated DNA damage response endonuclease PdeM [Ferruginibacter albus]|uniref:ligase-associated DNA damage response endonuclease PdeM n=1 Tax=Ferruginibacter albus TaxID=2875540 RepID=UPI001CC7E83B|nr:ligase-associated DNA damage response endonuclease PdeM [Ferruginibacter albus]UAY50638.1 ligase-associated DNA damage response endonuclease PdeM [Ferruginibacter albus]